MTETDPFLSAALELGVVDQRAAREAAHTAPGDPAGWLVENGHLSEQAERQVRQLLRARANAPARPEPPRRTSTVRGRSVNAPSSSGSGGLALAGLAFAAVLGGGLFVFKDKLFSRDDTTAVVNETDGVAANAPSATGDGTNRAPSDDAPNAVAPKTIAKPDDTAPAGAPGAEPNRAPEAAKAAPKKGAAAVGDAAPAGGQGQQDEKDGKPARKASRDPKVLAAADKEYAAGEVWNKKVAKSDGAERTTNMVNALSHYTEALVLYRKYCGTRVPSFLEKRYRALNGNIAILRKLLPPDKIKPFVSRIVEEKRTAKDLLADAEARTKETPLDYANNFMAFQRVLDEHPSSIEALRALARIGEVGWLEIEAINKRRAFGESAKQWTAAMRAGQYADVRAGLKTVETDRAFRAAMQSEDWAWYQTFERALRVPKAAAEKLPVGTRVDEKIGRLKLSGRVEAATEDVIIVGGKQYRFAQMDPLALARFALGEKLTGSRALTRACFLAMVGKGPESEAALKEARKKGAPVDDYVDVIDRLARIKPKR